MTMLEKSKKTGRVAQKRDHTHPNPQVRLAAVEKLEDPEVLIEVACTDDSPRVRLTAVSRLGHDMHLERGRPTGGVSRCPVWWPSSASSRRGSWRTC